jgi:hypothetical protein
MYEDLYVKCRSHHPVSTKVGCHVSKIPQYQISDLHTPTANLTTFQKCPLYFGITVFNHLPTSIKNTSHDINQFRTVDMSSVTYVAECMNKQTKPNQTNESTFRASWVFFICVHMNRWMIGWKEEAVLIGDLQSYDIKTWFQKFPHSTLSY